MSISEIAKRFGAPEKEILEDLNLLFVCGLPDYTPADLIEVSIEEDTVIIRMADYFARPLRLTRTEAIPLYLKAQALVNLLQGSGDGAPVSKELASLKSALEKLGKALLPQEGGVAELTKRIKVQLESGEAKWLSLLREAVTERRRVDLEYYTYSRDNMTKRRSTRIWSSRHSVTGTSRATAISSQDKRHVPARPRSSRSNSPTRRSTRRRTPTPNCRRR